MLLKVKKKSLIASAMALGMGLGMAGNANAAYVYAAAYNNLSSFFIGPAGLNLLSATFNINTSADLSSIAGVDGHGGSISSGSAPFNVTQAIQQDGFASGSGSIPENTFTPVAPGTTATSYARGDAQLPVTTLNPGSPPSVNLPFGGTTSLNIAESYLNTNRSGTADAGNGSTTTFNLTLLGDSALSFSFNADPYLQAIVTPGTIFSSKAIAEDTVNISITRTFAGNPGGNQTVFSWAPGTAPTVGDGGGSVNPFSLNENRSLDQNTPGVAEYDPTGDGIGGATGSFSASTVLLNRLAPGGQTYVYTIQLRQNEHVDTELTVPEPDSIALLGIGFTSLVFMSKRRRKA
jgi:hypothetical protein